MDALNFENNTVINSLIDQVCWMCHIFIRIHEIMKFYFSRLEFGQIRKWEKTFFAKIPFFQAGIETVLLIENAKEAQKIMWNDSQRPKHSFKVIFLFVQYRDFIFYIYMILVVLLLIYFSLNPIVVQSCLPSYQSSKTTWKLFN